MSLPARIAPVLVLFASVLPVAHAATSKTVPVVSNPTEIAVYVPPSTLTARTYLPGLNLWIEPGKAFADALDEVGRKYFPAMHVVPGTTDARYGLVVDMAPKWSRDTGRPMLTVKYQVLGTDGKQLLDGEVEQPIRGSNLNAGAATASGIAVQQILYAVQQRLSPNPAKYPATGTTSQIDMSLLVDREKPLRTGTAFYINRTGQLLTAAHVSRDCMVMEAHQNGSTFPVTAKAASDLLDIAVLDSGKPRATSIALRQGHQMVLGEAVTSVGFPLQGLLGDTPNVTRGNVSASKGLRGSLGMFQFSAPIQPGNSGGPIVSDNGELLGVAVSTLNAATLAKLGQIPQNVNFALDAHYVAMFLQREKVPFEVIQPKGAGSLQAANQAALTNTVQLNCYQ